MKRKRKLATASKFILALVLAVFMSLPFIWMLVISFSEDPMALFRGVNGILSAKFTFANYARAIDSIQMVGLFKNTMILVVFNMGIGITASVLVAYGFARFRSKYRNTLFYIMLSTMMLPWVVTMVPAYIIFSNLGWLNSFLPLIVPSIGGNAFYIFMLRQYIMGIPRDLDEAAIIDGCNSLQVLYRILLPQCKPIIATLVVFSFSGTWSDFVGPNMYLEGSEGLRTLSVGLQYFRSTNSVMPWNEVMAACAMFALPMLIVMFLAQNSFIKGIVTTGIK